MERNTLEKFFTAKSFEIPTYQRDYAWTQGNIDDLLDDIKESIETGTNHYIGTFILSRVGTEGVYHVVDGQQRLTTLTLILNAVVQLLPGDQKVIASNVFACVRHREEAVEACAVWVQPGLLRQPAPRV